MDKITAQQAFYIAPPRRPAVLCMRNADGSVRYIMTEWFSWLNMKHQPMLSFSMPRGTLELKEKDAFLLAFPSPEEALLYKQGFTVSGGEKPTDMPELINVSAVSAQVPNGSELVLWCTLASAYNFPFKKVRIFNCNLDEALKL